MNFLDIDDTLWSDHDNYLRWLEKKKKNARTKKKDS